MQEYFREVLSDTQRFWKFAKELSKEKGLYLRAPSIQYRNI